MTKVCLMCGDTFPDATTFCPKDGAALRAAVQGDDIIGEVFCDRYVVTDLLGEGGMGAVYVARDVRLPQQVAIKVLRERAMADPSTVARFRQEAEAASRINHDRIARVTDFGFMNDGRAYLIMEYVKGRTLRQVMDERAPMTAADVARIAGMIAEGLDAAHRLGIVHRDLKPDNVMIVDDEGGGLRLKLLDFGIAKVLHSDDAPSRTAMGFVIGTPQWMSPEQILGSTIDARSDVYSLGLLVYAMLTGRRAYNGATQEEEMMARLTAAPNRLAAVMPTVRWPDGLQALLDRTLSRDVNTRPANALLFAQELATVISRDTAADSPVGQSAAPSMGRSPEHAATRSTTSVAGAGSSNRDALTAARQADAGVPPAAPVQTVADVRETTPTNTRRNVVGAAIAMAVVAVMFLVVRQMGENSGGPNEATLPNAPEAQERAVAKADSTTNVLTNATVPASDRLVNAPPVVTPNASTTAPPKSATPNASPSTSGGSGNVRPPAPVPATPRITVNTPDSTRSAVNSANAVTAQAELVQIMDEADADVGAGDNTGTRAKARETIRKLEQLTPRLRALTDRGNAYLYMGMSQATLGENDKACDAVKRAASFAAQSPALRRSVNEWLQLLKCAE